jgi:tetratricopeptide (TPR) repeat protein
LWDKAVKALERARERKPGLALASANLGVAYLVHPIKTNLTRAAECFQKALEVVEKDDSLPPLAKAAVWVNASVADLAMGLYEAADKKLARAETINGALPEGPLRGAGKAGMRAALLYNRALLADRSQRAEDAWPLYEQYLGSADPDSAWYPVAYDRYAELGKRLNKKVQAKEGLARPRGVRPVTTVSLKVGGQPVELVLGKSPADLPAQLRKYEVTIPVTDYLQRIAYRDLGVSLLASEKHVWPFS